MTAAIAHRGPDGAGHWVGSDFALGHARLAIIDLNTGAQPMWDALGQKVIVFNGEIYNYQVLQTQLRAKGFTFRTHSDTETIAAAIAAWGIEEGLQRLRGMFAFALYDTATRTMLLARDRVGIKPLYYARTRDGLLFASEQKALLASDVLTRRVNPVAVHDYLAQGHPTTPDTCWAEIQMLEPGTWLQVGPAGERTGRFWSWRSAEDSRLSFDAATDRLCTTLTEALRYHLISDVPLAAFLSGGLDSSLIVALLSRGLMPGIHTFTMGFGDPAFDESASAREIAATFGTSHHELQLDRGENDPDLFTRIVNQYDEPFGDSSCLPTYLVCREMRNHVKVAISGDGGDEVLGGYVRYARARQLAALSHLRVAAPVVTPLVELGSRRLGWRGHQVSKAWDYAQLPRIAMLHALPAYFSEAERLGMYREPFADLALSAGPTVTRFARFVPTDEPDPVKQLIAADFQLRLHADYLRKVDVASSAHGLEVRVPYLDNALLEMAMVLPTRYRISNTGTTKLLARRLASELLPRSVAAAGKKGFSIPLDRWVRPRLQRFLHDLLLDPRARLHTWLSRDAVRGVWNDFANPRPGIGLSRFQRYQRAFLLISLELWLRRWDPVL
jgi:asparagine synthase (glutamine-hydrolysing)